MNLTIQKKIDTLQALRGVAILGIVMHHTNFKIFRGTGIWGVSLFLVLSGFLMTYNYYDKGRIDHVSIKNNIKFAYKKIGIHIYLLHILVTIFSSVFLFVGSYHENMIRFLIKMALNICLLQEWIPISGRSINETSWFLSTILFCYFIFPYILERLEVYTNRRKSYIVMFILFILQIFLGILGSRIHTPVYTANGWLDFDFTNWFVYRFPFSRSIDFVIGCYLGYFFVKYKEGVLFNVNKTILSVVSIVLIIVANLLVIIHKPNTNDLISHPEKWWIYSVIFTMSSCMLVYLAALKETLVARIVKNRVTIYLGNISQYIFLIHYVVFVYISSGITVMFGNEFSAKNGGWIKLLIGLPITLVVNKVWMKIINRNAKL